MNQASSTGTRALKASLERARKYFGETIWRPDPTEARLPDRIGRRVSRYIYLVVRGFLDDRVLVRAPALTLTTLLALVPLLALIAAVAEGFGLYRTAIDQLEGFLTDFVAVGQKDVVDVVLRYVRDPNLGALGGIGLLFLLYMSVSLMSTIEGAFNDIWGVDRSRPFHRRVSDYLSILIIFPVLLIASTGLTAGLSSTALVDELRGVAILSGAMEIGLKALPILVLGAGFSFLYKFMPYTAVRNRAAIVAGFFTGVAWHLAQWVFIQFQIGVTHNNVIYGTFAALPIFLIWLNASWIIVLVGCEIAYAVQHEATYCPPVPEESISIAQRERTALQLLAEVWQRFVRGEPPLSAGDLAAEVDLPRPVTVEILRAMLDCGLLARAAGPHEGLLPARDLRRLSVGEILLAYRHAGGDTYGEHGVIHDARVDELHRRLEKAFRAEGSEQIEAIFQTS